MTPPISPLAPVRPDPKAKKKKEMETKTQLQWLLIPLVLTSLLAIRLMSVPLMILGVVVWVGWIAYYILVSRVLLPDGASTPSVAQHSNIEAMVARGQYVQAADAYRKVLVESPQDLVACDKLAQLALRELKDFDTAIFAYREAEQRTTEPRRQVGYAILIAGIYRDNLKDNGKAMVELRRILARYPDAPNADKLRAELEQLKAAHFEGA